MDLAARPLFLDADGEYPYPRAQELVRWTVETFGADRVMWGTDNPVLLNSGIYRQLLDWVRSHRPFLTDVARAQILGGTAERFLRLVG